MPPRDLRAYLFDIAAACRLIEVRLIEVRIDLRGDSGYRLFISSPSDQPVSASAGVFFCERR